MPFKDAEKRREAARDSMRRKRGSIGWNERREAVRVATVERARIEAEFERVRKRRIAAQKEEQARQEALDAPKLRDAQENWTRRYEAAYARALDIVSKWDRMDLLETMKRPREERRYSNLRYEPWAAVILAYRVVGQFPYSLAPESKGTPSIVQCASCRAEVKDEDTECWNCHCDFTEDASPAAEAESGSLNPIA